jgi:putative hydrolase of the HAD superfamily
MREKLTTIAFDADDTLWHTERFFRLTQAHFAALLRDFTEPDHLEARLLEAERRNISHYGYGIKGFVLSMIETAIEVTDEKVPASVIAELMAAGREMLNHPIELLPHATEAVETLASTHKILLITKGDLIDQERKLAQSGLGDVFDWVEIMSHKTSDIYRTVFAQHGDGPERAMMVGDSMRSDIVPAIAVGSWAAHVPQSNVWELERAEAPSHSSRFHSLESLQMLPDLVKTIG